MGGGGFKDLYSNIFVENKNIKNIIVSGFDNYDPNKKNAIFLGSSLFTPLNGEISASNFSRLQKFQNIRKIIQEQMMKFLKQFPQNEYNILFKLHPRFTSSTDSNYDIARNYVKLITKNLINEPMILDPNIPLEIMISNDYNEFKNGTKNNFIFKENKKYKVFEWTTFFGLQATTTSIHTTRLFYQQVFNLNKYDVARLIPFSNFPIPQYFPVVDRLNQDIIQNHFISNREKIFEIYSYYCPSIRFKNSEILKIYDSIVLNFD